MERASKKKATAGEGESKEKHTLEKLMLDRNSDKYSLVGMASVWYVELRKREEYRHLNQNELLEQALREVLEGKVSADEIRTYQAAQAAETAQALASADHKEKK